MTVKKASKKKAPAKKAAVKPVESTHEEEVQEAKPKAASEGSGVVVFRSLREESQEFPVAGVRARRCRLPGFIEWHLPADEADDFAKHFHVRRGRIVRID